MEVFCHSNNDMKGKLYKTNLRRLVSIILAITVLVTSVGLGTFLVEAEETDTYTTLYLIDNTLEKWVGDDNAVIELVDNTSGHERYMMTKVNDTTWSVKVPQSAYNITFNRYSPDKSIQWNSWSAGGRDFNNAYFADGSEYGHWEAIEEIDETEEKYFHAGDIVYLDVSEFTSWKNDNAIMYVNFSEASKEVNNGNNISISDADKVYYNPKKVEIEVAENVYAYVITFEDEGATELRFWRGNDFTLWNCSVVLTYEDFDSGTNCVKISNWNSTGELTISQYSMDLEKDTDGDGLTDYNEWAYGTDINDVDSDNDGLSDYEEIGIIGTDATNVDTDSDGILDGDEDADNDGLTNSEECQYGTSSCTLDTDGDKVSDYDEIYSYQTNPLNMDTDGDGADDKWEIDREYDANAWDNSFCIIQKEQGLDTAAEIELFASGEVASSFAMRIHENDGVFINSLIPGYLGSAYDFVIDGEFETATLKYYFDESYLEEEGFNPVIYYYNEETHELEEIDTYWDGESNYVTAELSHFSTYLLLNKTKFEEVWEKEIKAPSVEGGGETSLNIAFVVDLSGSMSGTKLSTTKTAIKSFINVLGDNDLGALISFTNKAFIRCKLTSDKDALTASVNSMSACGLTAIYAGIEKAVSTLTQNPVSGYDMIIVFTDGYDEPSTTYEAYYKELVQQAIDNNIIIYTIGIQTVDENLLKTISQATGGSYYYASVISELQDKLDSIKQETVDYTTDSNDDGISDYYTKLICNGTLRLSTGSVIPEFIGNYDEIQKNADYDKDGLNNGKEIEIVEKYGRVYFEILSDPTEADFDEDGILDSAEKANKTNPFIYNASTIDVDYLFYDDIYIASMLGKDYLDDGVLRAQLGFGNLLLNGKGTYVNDYKQALLQFIELYNDAVFEEGKVAAIKDMYMENLDEIMLELTNYALVLDDVAFELSGYAEAASLYEKSAEKLISLKNTLKTIEDYKSLVEFNDEINTTCLNLQVQLLEQESANAAASKAIKSSKLIGNLEKKMGQYINNMPSKVTTAMKAINAFNNVISYGTIVIGTGADVLETLDLYGALDIGMIQYVELDEFLESIILYSDNSELVLAATDVRYALSEDFARSISEIGMVVGDLGEGAYTAALTFALSKCGPIGWAIGLGWSLGDLMSNTSTVNEELLKVIAYGDAGVSYRKKLENRLPYETPLYYQCNVSLLTELQLLGQLRVVGEDKYAYAQNERGFLKMWIDGIFGDTQEEVEETCRDTIEAVVRKCNNFQVSIYKKFIGSYLN